MDLSGKDASIKYAQAVSGIGKSWWTVPDDSMFEIGSITKVFTGILLQIMVDRNVVKFETPLAELLPAEAAAKVRVPEVRAITLRQLATHTSGLPRLPSNLHGPNDNPFSDYTQADLFGYLANLTALGPQGVYSYSNLGFGLLGFMLELKTGVKYRDLVWQEITAKLGMNDTLVNLDDYMWDHTVVPGHCTNGTGTMRRSDYGVLQGNGALHSTIRDMLLFAQAHLESYALRGTLPPQSLERAMHEAAMPVTRDDNVEQKGLVGLGWQIYQSRLSQVVWKSGGTAGYSAYLAFDGARARAAIALESCGGCGRKAVQSAAQVLLDGPPPQYAFVKTSAQEVLPFVGCFRLYDGVVLSPYPVSLQITAVQPGGKLQLVADPNFESAAPWVGSAPIEMSAFRPDRATFPAAQFGFVLSSRPSPSKRRYAEGNSTTKLAHSVDDDGVGLGPPNFGPELNLRREIYFLRDETDPTTIDMAVLHVDSWDTFYKREPLVDGKC